MKIVAEILFLSLWLANIDANGANVNGETSLIFKLSSGVRKLSRQKRQFGPPSPPRVEYLTVTSTIVARFSETVMESEVMNDHYEPQTTIFKTQISKTAFISGFSMVIDNEEFFGEVKEKETAIIEFGKAQSEGLDAGLVKTDDRETSWFTVSINVGAVKSVIFRLTHQELLLKRNGEYRQVIYANPQQTVEKFEVNVRITEPTGFKSLEAVDPYIGPELTSPQDFSFQPTTSLSESQANVRYYKENHEVADAATFGRRFVVKYDVKQPSDEGSIWTHNGYFVHFFAPLLPRLPKRIVFAIDRSGSMNGKKMEQVKQVYATILDSLDEKDSFGIVSFGSNVDWWKNSLQFAFSKQNVEEGKKYVQGLKPTGATNFTGAVLEGINLLKKFEKKNSASVRGTSLMFVLTDGNPTRGVTNRDEARRLIKQENINGYPIFSLGFGRNVDKDFLNKLSKGNNGKAREIFEGSDASEQIREFYDEIATPLLTELTMTYLGSVNSVSQSSVPVFYKGSEVTVVGKVEESSALSVDISGNGLNAQFKSKTKAVGFNDGYSYPVAEGGNQNFNEFFSRMWAYITVTQLLDQKQTQTLQSEVDKIDREIIKIALQYSFVTPLTAMIVVKPQNEQVSDLNEGQGGWKDWSDWGICTPIGGGIICGGKGSQTRRRVCFTGTCEGPDTESQECRVKCAPPPPPTYLAYCIGRGCTNTPEGNWGKWSDWTTCSAECGRGKKSRTRKCEPINAFCYGSALHTQTCEKPATSLCSVDLPPVRTNPQLIARRHNCGSVLQVFDRSVTIASPGVIYPRKMLCKWEMFGMLTGRMLELRFWKFDLEYSPGCTRDRVVVYVDGFPSARRPIVLCGWNVSRFMRIRASMSLVIVFESNPIVQGTGFVATVQHV